MRLPMEVDGVVQALASANAFALDTHGVLRSLEESTLGVPMKVESSA